MIFRCGVCLSPSLPLSVHLIWLCFICSSLLNVLLFMFKGMLGSYILTRTVIVASMSFTHTRTSLLSTIQIRWENCLDNFAVLLGVLGFMKCHNWSSFCRSFMWISLMMTRNLWKQEDLWTWHILLNGLPLMSLLDTGLMYIWTIHSLSIRW
jgi:hypothetical protein